MMGIISTAMVVTSSERYSRPKTTQPGNREWVTVIQGVNSQGGPTLPDLCGTTSPWLMVSGK
ncbi:hypothetical protein LIPSTDRAFT_336507 [Lipomyces starkeyi NRRL Y-11557]|uniref:Uncharacterized protein n=1 Tax=Lipomyces starkeyi NRRL Y-11557 TaxID=675824 RepID=A0A1E3Q990_LIPST|nr:hypothetical protein LIPSTDRAFT_336507 [Lipomyces starkeyi NRRL Y-11557]